MKTIKFTLLVVMSLATCFILNACGNKQESATSSSSKVTQTTKSSEKAETSSTRIPKLVKKIRAAQASKMPILIKKKILQLRWLQQAWIFRLLLVVISPV